MTIKIEIPSDDPTIALAFGKALCEIGGQTVSDDVPAGKMPVYTAPGESTVEDVEEIVEKGKAAIDNVVESHSQLAEDGAALMGDDVPPPVEDADDDPKSDTAGDVAEKDESPVDHAVDVETDINGYPWDERIHSKNKSKNAGNTWRYCRMPKNFNDNKEAWQAYIEQTEAELKPATDDVPPPSVTETEEVAPPVTEDVTPPPADTDTYPEKSFPQLMTLVTSNRQNGAIEKIEQVLASMGIVGENGKPVLAVLNANHKDRVSEAYAKLEGAL